MKKRLLIIVATLIPMLASAHDFEVNGIYYNITSHIDLTVEVVRGNDYGNSYSGDIIVPEEVAYNNQSYLVKSIGEFAFYNCSSLTSVALPENVTTIGALAFYGCKKLTSINMPNGLTCIEKRLFYDCNSLTSITIPDNVAFIGESAFEYCSSLTSVNIPKKVATIGERAFAFCI